MLGLCIGQSISADYVNTVWCLSFANCDSAGLTLPLVRVIFKIVANAPESSLHGKV